ncbi:AAA family ATPase [Blastopirellula retiformator]|uniref:Holliday junction ATP-dependent DNA helicase RuvB n=1 Tax=Blastopirellula retiformator TaxID=2527970 RepID=A0A5C5UVR7_9BACT|nr:MoxR family ATPase [Blastopirellula retiformator]TWT29637.1 Holliday junction ATP-dependent DNA helicase RuvB [Blastopirellula retiformator]
MHVLASQHQHDSDTPSTCKFQPFIDGLRDALNSTLKGKSDVVELVIACLLARGHLLLEDLPGLGKTTLAKALAGAVGGRFARVQCTPDLLPTDVTGFSMFNQQTREFEFVEGPVFSDVLLADEINRTTPRTQSALFEAMAERQVTIDKSTHRLTESFFVIATQNPVDSHGAYPLPEAQLDRFAMKLTVGYPDPGSELEMLAENIGRGNRAKKNIEPILTPHSLQELQDHVASVHVEENVCRYLVDLASATRNHRDITLGLSPRGLLTLQRVAQARAHLHGRDFVTPDDVQEIALPVLQVRLAGDYESPRATIEAILSDVSVPVSK